MRERGRADMILLRLDGVSVTEAAACLKTAAKRVSTWSKRFERHGLDGLKDQPGRGRKPSIPASKVQRVVTRPPKGRKSERAQHGPPRWRVAQDRATGLVDE
ncbi:helix-turn-helix domain-containing protein [Bradyrhizobium sp.]|uniref:helix-turn-helix domain-containing protein n=1 Tax=Bradyrhizobium sp. TaxID=376 RepID=UPI0034466DBF